MNTSEQVKKFVGKILTLDYIQQPADRKRIVQYLRLAKEPREM